MYTLTFVVHFTDPISKAEGTATWIIRHPRRTTLEQVARDNNLTYYTIERE